MILIRIKDGGVGIPEEIDIENADTLGLKLARNPIRSQLKGKLQIDRNEGTDVHIEFKLDNG